MLEGRIPTVDIIHAFGCRDGLVLMLLNDRRSDAQATLTDLVLVELTRSKQLLLNLGHQIASRARHRCAIERVGIDRLWENGGITFSGGEPAVLNHEIQVAFPAFLRLVRVDGRIPRGGRGNDGGQQRRLGQCQLVGTVAEVGLGGRVDSVGATTEVDRVHVGADDLVLGLLTVDLDREDSFFEFARVRRGLTHVVAFNVLLGEGRTALSCASPQVVDERAENTLQVDAVVRVERAVFGGHDRLGDIVGQGRRVDDLPVDVTEGTHLGRTVRVVHGGFLRERQVIRRGNGQRVVQVQERGHASNKDPQEDGQDSESDALGPAETLLRGALLVTRRGLGVLLRRTGSMGGMNQASRGKRVPFGRAFLARPDDVIPAGFSVASRHVFALSADSCTSRLTMFPERSPNYGHKHRG